MEIEVDELVEGKGVVVESMQADQDQIVRLERLVV